MFQRFHCDDELYGAFILYLVNEHPSDESHNARGDLQVIPLVDRMLKKLSSRQQGLTCASYGSLLEESKT